MNEDTLVKTMPLPHGRTWVFYEDANVIALAPHLTPEQHEQVIVELYAQWRRTGIRRVPGPRFDSNVTQPLPTGVQPPATMEPVTV